VQASEECARDVWSLRLIVDAAQNAEHAEKERCDANAEAYRRCLDQSCRRFVDGSETGSGPDNADYGEEDEINPADSPANVRRSGG